MNKKTLGSLTLCLEAGQPSIGLGRSFVRAKTDMGFSTKISLLLLFSLVLISSSERSSAVQARPLNLHPQKYSNIIESLGVVCKCCDETGGECTSSWTKPCSKLQCFPWKQH